jgi:TPR repeat protein
MIQMWSGRAHAGDAAAQYQLGACYEMGVGTTVDLGAACTWYRRAAAQGHPRAQYHLGLAYSFGAPGVPWDLAEACKWLTMAARNGISEASGALNELKAPREQRLLGEKMAREFAAVQEPQTTDAIAEATPPQATTASTQLGFNF